MKTLSTSDLAAGELKEKVYDVVRDIPFGHVLTYGIVATLCGKPRNYRQVGRILSNAPQGLGAHRVVSHNGRTAPGCHDQRRLLENEGVTFKENGCVNMNKHLWRQDSPTSENITHNFEPVYRADSKVLILGTMPSPKSRENGFYYGHPRNRFWQVLAAVLNTSVPTAIEEKKQMLTENQIALWDVLKSCTIEGARDSSIKNPVVNDFSAIFSTSPIKAVFTTGKTATKLYTVYCFNKTLIPAHYLPSTSPAGRMSFDSLVFAYNDILEYLR